MGTDHSGMLSNTRTVRIEWGDCDPAGIVFFPRYFELFDHSTTLLIERALGMRKREFYAFYAFDGYPVVDTRARFLAPTRFGDDVVIETTLAAINRASFEMAHRLSLDGELAVEGSETRVWVVRDASRPGGFRAEPIPAEVVAKLKATR
jgi:4-hydroxybenzoyl-CoA thioesterase